MCLVLKLYVLPLSPNGVVALFKMYGDRFACEATEYDIVTVHYKGIFRGSM